jgi:hypothetical protein
VRLRGVAVATGGRDTCSVVRADDRERPLDDVRDRPVYSDDLDAFFARQLTVRAPSSHSG